MACSECRVPQELIEAIIRNLEGDQRTLARCARVSIRFLSVSQKLLYKKIVLEPPIYRGKSNPRSINHFHGVLASHPLFADYVEDLTISHKGPLFTWLDAKATNWLSNPHDTSLLEAMKQLKNLRKLKVSGVLSMGRTYDSPIDWKNLSDDMQLAFNHACNEFQHLSVLHLHCITNLDVSLFDISKNLQELVFDAVTFASWELDGDESVWEPLPDRSRLKKLCVHTYGTSSLHFARYLTSYRTGFNLSYLESLHYTNDCLQEHWRLCKMLDECESSLLEFEFSPSVETYFFDDPDPLTFSRLANLRLLSLSLWWEIDSVGGQGPLGWLKSRLNELAYFNCLEVLRLRCHFRWVDGDGSEVDHADALDWEADIMPWWLWREADRILSDTDAFSELKRVEICFIPRDGDTLLPIKEFCDEVRANAAKLLERKMLYISQGSLRFVECLS
ncbi:hypothetical protein D9756_008193 [Leucocoprinus leucothites]|uniref:F-box domain-containing protein n=1 Tax=Leucocoprinus leucothites TaxID=201217 RepID=A0A8H5D0K3_9AGAR|nr:hypothetical protein D9756_008193 [Leucoagaricus leucothites]